MGRMKEEARLSLEEFNAQQHDWYGKCRKCGKQLNGTIQQIREHVCEDVLST